MKYSISKAAQHVGVTRKTFYKHIKTKGISVDRSNPDKPVIDASELIRVYGSDFKADLDDKQGVNNTEKPEQGAKALDQAVELAVLKREVELITEQRDQFEKLYQEEKASSQSNLKLLTDERQKQSQWELMFEKLQNQVSLQEQTTSRELSELKETVQIGEKRLRQTRRALQQERNKTLWQKLFTGQIKK